MKATKVEANGVIRGPNNELLGRVQSVNPRDYDGVQTYPADTYAITVGRRVYFLHATLYQAKDGRRVFWIQPQGDEPPRRFFTFFGALATAVEKARLHQDECYYWIRKAQPKRRSKKQNATARRK